MKETLETRVSYLTDDLSEGNLLTRFQQEAISLKEMCQPPFEVLCFAYSISRFQILSPILLFPFFLFYSNVAILSA